jgi:hypothetical protein
MSYMAVKDLKKTRFLRERLEKERELILLHVIRGHRTQYARRKRCTFSGDCVG